MLLIVAAASAAMVVMMVTAMGVPALVLPLLVILLIVVLPLRLLVLLGAILVLRLVVSAVFAVAMLLIAAILTVVPVLVLLGHVVIVAAVVFGGMHATVGDISSFVGFLGREIKGGEFFFLGLQRLDLGTIVAPDHGFDVFQRIGFIVAAIGFGQTDGLGKDIDPVDVIIAIWGFDGGAKGGILFLLFGIKPVFIGQTAKIFAARAG